MACPSWRNRRETNNRKTEKYTTVRKELTERNEGFKVRQTNIVVDVLGGYDKEVTDELKRLLGKSKANKVLSSMQRTVLLHALRIMNSTLSC